MNVNLFSNSKAGVYTSEEVIKIFQSKICKLESLYKNQLEIMSDQILTSRKKYLNMRLNENKSIPPQKTYKKSSNLVIKFQKFIGHF